MVSICSMCYQKRELGMVEQLPGTLLLCRGCRMTIDRALNWVRSQGLELYWQGTFEMPKVATSETGGGGVPDLLPGGDPVHPISVTEPIEADAESVAENGTKAPRKKAPEPS